jgi:hypothetical protein
VKQYVTVFLGYDVCEPCVPQSTNGSVTVANLVLRLSFSMPCCAWILLLQGCILADDMGLGMYYVRTVCTTCLHSLVLTCLSDDSR